MESFGKFIIAYFVLPIVHIFCLVRRLEIIAAVHAFFFSHLMIFAISFAVVRYDWWKVVSCLAVHYISCLIIQQIKIFQTMRATSDDWDKAAGLNEGGSSLVTADIVAQIQTDRIHDAL